MRNLFVESVNNAPLSNQSFLSTIYSTTYKSETEDIKMSEE